MMKFSLAAAALALGTSALVPTASADAQRYGGPRYERAYGNAYNDGYNRRDDRYDRRAAYNRSYRERRGYNSCQRNSGGTGTIVGAIAGGLLGRTIDTRGDRTIGTLGGAVLGGLAGRAVERSDRPGYCR